jgi:hypothetical protein
MNPTRISILRRRDLISDAREFGRIDGTSASLAEHRSGRAAARIRRLSPEIDADQHNHCDYDGNKRERGPVTGMIHFRMLAIFNETLVKFESYSFV